MYYLAIRKCTYISNPVSPEIENFQMKIYGLDKLNQRQTCYHLSQRGEPSVGKGETLIIII